MKLVSRVLTSLLFVVMCLFPGGCRTFPFSKSMTISKSLSSQDLFEDPVRQILEHRCVHCHNDDVRNGGLNLQDRELVFEGDEHGPFLIPEDPDDSRIWQAIIRPEKHKNAMPADGWGLEEDQLREILEWIQKGAYWPEGERGRLRLRYYQVTLKEYY